MQTKSNRCISSPQLVLFVASIVAIEGCASHVYKAAQLPPELCAPAPLNLEALNLSGMANSSVSTEVIQPGDMLDINMVTDFTRLTTTTTPVRVAADGTAVVPLVGRVAVGGMDIKQAEQVVNVESINRGIFRGPSITLTMKQFRTIKVAVGGAVNKPGTQDLPRGGSSLMAALMAAGGLTKEAGTEVEIRHIDSRQVAADAMTAPPPADPMDPNAALASYQQASLADVGPTVTKIDLAAASTGVVKVPELSDGDVVQVMKRTLRPIHVLGLVQRPGEYVYPVNQEIRVLDALALAGGVSNAVAEDIIVIRQVPNAPEPVRIAVSLQSAKNGRDNLALAPGDTVSIEQTPMTAALDALKTFFHVSVGGTMSWF